MAFSPGTYGPEDLEKLAAALNEIARARNLGPDSLDRAWIARELMEVYDPDDLAPFAKTVELLKSTANKV